jgi:hypothetical protein
MRANGKGQKDGVGACGAAGLKKAFAQRLEFCVKRIFKECKNI